MVALADLMSLNGLLDFVFGNIVWFILFGGIVFLILNYLKVSSKKAFKPVDRSEIERLKFIDRLQNNDTEFRHLFRGKNLIGNIKKMSVLTVEVPDIYDKKKKKAYKKEEKAPADPEKEDQKLTCVVQLIVKPTISNLIRIDNPLSKLMAFQISQQNVMIDTSKKALTVPVSTYLDKYFGIFYDKNTEYIHSALILKDNVIRTDIDLLSSIYFAKSQEQATFDPEKAHALALKEKEIQVELAKRSSKLSQI